MINWLEKKDNIENLNKTVKEDANPKKLLTQNVQLELTDIYRPFHPETKEYTTFSAPSPKVTI